MNLLNTQIGKVTFPEFVDMLYDAGWRAPCDAQHSNLEKLYNDLVIIKTIEKLDNNG